MAYNVTQLITGAYYASGIIGREFETVSGRQITDALMWLNDILAEKRIDDGMIPYETTYNFNALTGIEKYFIPNLIQIDTLVFFLDKVRYAMQYTQRNQYFGNSRVENINTLPFEWYWERQVGGGNVYIYFKPDRTYPVEIHGLFGLNAVTEFQDLTLNTTIADLGIPTFYGLGTFNPGQFIVNNFDLMGNYSNIGALVNYINTGIIPGITANINVNDFVLSSITEPPIPIYVQTTGYPPSGTSVIGPIAAATTANLVSTYNNGVLGVGATLTATAVGVLIIDGYTVNLNDRILVINQTNPAQNGSYSLTTVGTGGIEWILTRTTNYDKPVQVNIGNLFTVINGTVNAGLTFVQIQQVSLIGTSPINFIIFNALTFSNFSTIGTPLYEVFNASGFDQFYTTYLRYALTDRICTEYAYDTPPNIMRQLSKYEGWINNKSRVLDLEMTKVSTLQKRGSYNWAFINLGKGWRPS
jgi:hypothetical protein